MKQLREYQKKAVDECIYSLIESNEPTLLMASVGSGKSIMLASVLMLMQKYGRRALCIVNNAELVRSNSIAFNELGGESSIYCSSLKSKDDSKKIIFGTPQSIISGIKNGLSISKIKFNLIVVDEAHMINAKNKNSIFMQIISHYRSIYSDMRILGATGTNYRFGSEKIVGDDCLFKKQVGNITTSWLIDNGFLVKPSFEIDESIDFSHLKVKKTGFFDSKELEDTINKNTRLTEVIMKRLVEIVESRNRNGVFIFASTKAHCYECASHLPKDETAVILGDMKQVDREDILNKARAGIIKYIVNISIISVGVDVPLFDTVVYVRPTESMVLFTQTLGRALRLHEKKSYALIIDCAGNIERHRDFDDPILIDAVISTEEKDATKPFECHCCHTFNSEFARRCIGVIDGKRCDHYFEFKECKACNAKNDISSRKCRACEEEIVNPNDKLCLGNMSKTKIIAKVLSSKYYLFNQGFTSYPIFKAVHSCKCGDDEFIAEEQFFTSSQKSKNIFWGKFVKECVNNPSRYYKLLDNSDSLNKMIRDIKKVDSIVSYKFLGKYNIVKRLF